MEAIALEATSVYIEKTLNIVGGLTRMAKEDGSISGRLLEGRSSTRTPLSRAC